jgi:hypothetical protein
MGLICALFLITLVFLASGQGDEVQALAIFVAWILLFLLLVWRTTSWRWIMAKGLLVVGLEFLALPLAWLFHQGLPPLSQSALQGVQTLPVVALGLLGGLVFCGAGLTWLLRRGMIPALVRQALLASIGILATLEASYGLLLLYVNLVPQS